MPKKHAFVLRIMEGIYQIKLFVFVRFSAQPTTD